MTSHQIHSTPAAAAFSTKAPDAMGWLQPLQHSVAAALQRAVSCLFETAEPIVHERVDRSGSTYWQIEDPRSQRTYIFLTAADACAWLETRH